MAREVPEIMTVKDVAVYLQVHESTIYRLLKRREIPAFKLGSDWRFRRATIFKWIAGKSGDELSGRD